MTNLDLHTQFLSISEQVSALNSNLSNLRAVLSATMPEFRGHIKTREALVQNVKEKACKHFSITIEQMDSPSRKQDYTMPRHAAFWICYEKMDLGSLKEIAKMFNRLDHGTVLSGIQTHLQRMKENKHFRGEMEILLKECQV